MLVVVSLKSSKERVCRAGRERESVFVYLKAWYSMNFVIKFCYWFITAWVGGVQFARPVQLNEKLVGQRSEYRAQRTGDERNPEVVASGSECFASVEHRRQQPESENFSWINRTTVPPVKRLPRRKVTRWVDCAITIVAESEEHQK